MNINRYNYEEYFLLYVDNELSVSERGAIEQFVQENPDLEEELIMLKQSQLKPDPSMVMEDKSFLFKSSSELINTGNCENFLLLYVDNELSVDERSAVEQLVSGNPAIAKELGLLLQARLSPESPLSFPYKHDLYRSESERVIAIRWWKAVAVAALVLLALGILWMQNTQPVKPARSIVKTTRHPDRDPMPAQKTTKAAAESTMQSTHAALSTNAVAASSHDAQISKVRVHPVNAHQSNPMRIDEAVKQYALTQPDETNSVTGEQVHPAAIEKPKMDRSETALNQYGNKTLIVDEQYPASTNSMEANLASYSEQDNSVTIGPIETKNKMRGFFRKVTRVIGKATHLPAAENKSLLIGNIAIALK